ncbi:alcohol dehydrogenase catalytic domain-containing protein [Bradyrhizobium jicamae]|uniref:Alcohol dehydrogenase catalytic domain-containing protein n=1 Tax=Bradyrhizobium jicamae TaxID=280332 RepID=A0ABS5FRT5_9BRAD|nr:alcohol dehydrogenase catalytic domain-containing protein [Bradyrhizobium jicamae]MBR0799493.1 alcohol dehydrogenase catalytic domain-containing protein [Bradyrhizobium jicamae]
MKALAYAANNRLQLEDRPRPEPQGPHDVLVRVRQTGICGTDRSILVGKFRAKVGTVLGHESVGHVEKIGTAVTRVKVGERVIINPTLYCGSCDECLSGHTSFCLHKSGTEVGVDRDGAFAEFILLPEHFLHRIPDGMSFDRAVMVEPLACAINNVEAATTVAGEDVVVVGAGPIGVVTAMLCLHMGTRITLIESDSYRRQHCAHIFKDSADRITLAHPEHRLRRVGDVVIDSVGDQLDACLSLAKDRGRIVVMGYNSRSVVSIRPLELVQRAIRVIGAGDYCGHLFPRAVELARLIPLEAVISDRFSLSEFEKAFSLLAPNPAVDYHALKVLLVPDLIP